ncbi:MAG: twin-arginine translocase subunit TatC [Thermoleophilia bacterium]|nr:twin-arginine translocase subunit TatC [Thermoleophilia bacterium]
MNDTTNDRMMSLIGHLEELRKRIIISLVAIAVGMLVCFIFKGFLLEMLTAPLGEKKLITLSPTESFMTVFKVAGYTGMILASPVIIYQIWAFVAPGLRAKEKRVIFFATFFTSILFLAGVAFAWIFVLPRTLDFLLTYEEDIFNQQVQSSQYFTFVAMFMLGFGIIFETPAMILSLVRLGIVDPKYLRKKRKYAILIGVIASAALTPGQDLFSMLAMAIPFILLFEISLVLSRFVKPARDESIIDADDDLPDPGDAAS